MRFRWLIILVALVLSVLQLLRPPEEEGSWELDNYKKNIRLGLDLRGGIFMQLEVDVEDAVNQYLEEQAGMIKGNLEAEGLTMVSSEADPERNSVLLTQVTAAEDKDIMDEIRRQYRGSWNIDKRGDDVVMRLRENARTMVGNSAVDQTVYKVQSRVDELGVTEPVINRVIGSNRIVVELAGANDVTRVHKIVREPGKLEWRLNTKIGNQPMREAANEQEILAQFGGQLPPGKRIFPYPNPNTGAVTYMLLEEVLLTAANVDNVRPSTDDRGLPAVGITLDREGGQIFQRATGNNVGNRLAIVLDGEIVSAPRIDQRLSNNFIIHGSFTQQEVQDLVVKINSGRLPAKVEILEERELGPTLGRDAIRNGSISAMVGLALVMIFITLYYQRAGIFALFALLLNMLFILGMLAGLGAVLTLPGIAGFILTIGMAVDANVLVFERIREELRNGTAPKNAVEIGYKSAFVTIMDANITTFIAAFCLLLMGEGPIKGFAVMLMIGIISSIFTAVFCSRTFFMTYLSGKRTLAQLSIWPIWRGQPKGA